MPTPTKGARLGGSAAHQKAILANLATALFEHGRITTTEAKARRLRPVAERLISKAKRGDLHARRQVQRTIRDKSIVHALMTEIGPRYQTRAGGYTRIVKIGPRKGDNAPMAVIELVEPLAEQVVAEATGATRRAAKEAEQAASNAADAPATEESRNAEATASESTGAADSAEETDSADAEASADTEAPADAEAKANAEDGTDAGELAAGAAEGGDGESKADRA